MVLTGVLAVVSLLGPIPEPETLGVLPLSVVGELPQSLRADASARVLAGAQRSPFTVVEIADVPADCDATCLAGVAEQHGADYLLATDLTVADGQRRYRFTGRVYNATGAPLVEIDEGCEVCGFEEAATRVENASAAAAKMIDRAEVELAQPEPPPPTPPATSVDRPPPRDDPKARAMIGSGAALVAVSVPALVSGAVFLALQGRPYRGDCMADREGNCRRLWDTAPLGGALVATGAALLITGAVLLAVGKRRQRAAKVAHFLLPPARASTSAMRWAAFREPSFSAVR